MLWYRFLCGYAAKNVHAYKYVYAGSMCLAFDGPQGSCILWSSSIKAALCLYQLLPPFLNWQSKVGARACCVARPSPGHGLRCGVDYRQQEERDTDLWNSECFSLPLFRNHQPHLACKGGICSTKTENIQCSRVGVGSDTRIFTVNALH